MNARRRRCTTLLLGAALATGTGCGDHGEGSMPPGVDPGAACGDGVVEGQELCDLGDENGGGDCAWDCTPAEPFNGYDDAIRALLARWAIPGGAIAMTVQGRLVMVRGYGVMDRAGTPMDPLARFRIASISKPITATAVMQLVQDGDLDLDERAFDVVSDLVPADGTPEREEVDERLFDVTVEHLLHHAGGWDRTRVPYDPVFDQRAIAEAEGVPSPAGAEDVIRYMTRQPLDFDPGERFAYSNFGYMILGRIIERVTGTDYETHVQDRLLGPIGAVSMEIGASRIGRVAADETTYYSTSINDRVPSVFDEDGNPAVRVPYGGWSQRTLDAHGGWISTTLDLLRFSAAVDGFPSPPDVLDEDNLATALDRPEALWPEGVSPTYYYAMGWNVRVVDATSQNRWHDGSLPGTSAILVRTGSGVTWAALLNRRAANPEFFPELDRTLWEAFRTIPDFPDYDLFDRY